MRTGYLARKIVATAIVAAVVLLQVAFAAPVPSVTVDIDYGASVINARYDGNIKYNTGVIFALVKAGSALSADNVLRTASVDYIPGMTSVGVMRIGEDIPEGQYTVYATAGGFKSAESAAQSAAFKIYGKESQTTMLEAINSASDSDIAQVCYDNLSNLYGVSGGDYTYKNVYLKSIKDIDCGGSFKSLEQANDAWKTAEVLKNINKAADGGQIDALVSANAASLGVDKNAEFFEENRDGIFDAVYEEVADEPVYSKSELVTVVTNATVVTAYNNLCKSDPSKLDLLFTKYTDAIGVSDYMDKYGTINADKFARQFVNATAKDVKEIKSKFISVLNSLYDKKETNSSGAGGGIVRAEDNSYAGGTVNIQIPRNSTANSFSDVGSDHWAYSYIEALTVAGIVNGYGDGTFRPDAKITRGEFIKLIVSCFDPEEKVDVTPQFTDLSDTAWEYPYIKTMVCAQLFNGYGDGRCGSSDYITRQDASVLIKRVLDGKGIELISDSDNGFTDNESISDYAREAISALYASGIISGFEDGSFKPAENLTRAQCAKILYVSRLK